MNKCSNISRNIKTKIALDLSEKISEKELYKRHFVSHNTVSRIVDSSFDYSYPPYNSLPEHLSFDEFKSTKRCKGNISFIYLDATNHQILNIVENRPLNYLIKYFSHFTKQTGRNVNEAVERVNNFKVKMIKKVAFGYKSFFHFRNIILICKKLVIPTVMGKSKPPA